jgi:hypothetical protein
LPQVLLRVLPVQAGPEAYSSTERERTCFYAGIAAGCRKADLEGVEKMNGRQAARAAAKRIDELEYMVSSQSRDIKDYNAVVLDIIAGKSPCTWCEENRLDECEHASRGSAGCSEWWLRYSTPDKKDGGSDGKAPEETNTDGSLLNLAE